MEAKGWAKCYDSGRGLIARRQSPFRQACDWDWQNLWWSYHRVGNWLCWSLRQWFYQWRWKGAMAHLFRLDLIFCVLWLGDRLSILCLYALWCFSLGLCEPRCRAFLLMTFVNDKSIVSPGMFQSLTVNCLMRLCCCVRVTTFERWLTPFNFLMTVLWTCVLWCLRSNVFHDFVETNKTLRKRFF